MLGCLTSHGAKRITGDGGSGAGQGESGPEGLAPRPVAGGDAGFPTTSDGDQRIEARIGKRGQSTPSWTWTPSTLDVVFAEHCSLVREGSRDDVEDFQYVVEVNGLLVFRTTACSDGPREFLGDSFGMEPSSRRKDDRVRLGQPAQVSVFTRRGTSAGTARSSATTYGSVSPCTTAGAATDAVVTPPRAATSPPTSQATGATDSGPRPVLVCEGG
jgi:hypothetical protein